MRRQWFKAAAVMLLWGVLGVHGVQGSQAAAPGNGGWTAVSPESLREALRAYVLAQVPWEPRDVTIREISGMDTVVLPPGRVEYTFTPARGSTYVGRTPFLVRFLVDGRPVREVWVTADIGVMAQVVLAARPIARGEIITARHVYLGKRDLREVRRGAFTDLSDVVGKQAIRWIPANTPIRRTQVGRVFLIRRGARVRILAENARLRVTALGVAKQGGRKGDVIRVWNPDSRRSVYGVVEDENTVRVAF